MDTTNETLGIKLRHWAEIIHECKSSGLTDREWMNQNGIRRNQFYYWQRKLRAKALEAVKNNEKKSAPDALIEITGPVLPAAADPGIKESFRINNVPGCPALSIKIADAVIEVRDNTSPEILRMAIRELRHAQ